MEQGPVEAKILEQAFRSGMPIPAKIQNAPELRLGLQLFYAGFLDLSSTRQIGMDEGMIPWLAIQEYCCWLGLSEESTEDMHYHIGQMDLARRKHLSKKSTKGNQDGKPKGIRGKNAP